jgi:hypothetical protein
MIIFYAFTEGIFDNERGRLFCHVSTRACGLIFNGWGVVGTLLARRDTYSFDCQLSIVECAWIWSGWWKAFNRWLAVKTEEFQLSRRLRPRTWNGLLT